MHPWPWAVGAKSCWKVKSCVDAGHQHSPACDRLACLGGCPRQAYAKALAMTPALGERQPHCNAFDV